MTKKEQVATRFSFFGEDIDENSKRWNNDESFSWGLFLIFGGTILLFNNLNLIPWTIWERLFKAWPALLVFAGFKIILGESTFARILLSLISFFMFASLLGYVLSLYAPFYIAWVPESIRSYFQYWSLIIK